MSIKTWYIINLRRSICLHLTVTISRSMNLLVPVTTIMTKELITVQPDDSIDLIHKIFKTNKIHHLPVVESGKLMGIISITDFLCKSKGANYIDLNSDLSEDCKDLKATDLMTTGLAKLETTDKINIAIEVFRENLFHAIPVVESEKIVGLVTTFDIIEHLAYAGQ